MSECANYIQFFSVKFRVALFHVLSSTKEKIIKNCYSYQKSRERVKKCSLQNLKVFSTWLWAIKTRRGNVFNYWAKTKAEHITCWQFVMPRKNYKLMNKRNGEKIFKKYKLPASKMLVRGWKVRGEGGRDSDTWKYFYYRLWTGGRFNSFMS